MRRKAPALQVVRSSSFASGRSWSFEAPGVLKVDVGNERKLRWAEPILRLFPEPACQISVTGDCPFDDGEGIRGDFNFGFIP